MSYDQKLYECLREFFSRIPNVEEKKMFGGVAFIVNGKMCMTVGPDRIMCRIDPVRHDEALAKKGTKTVQMRGKDYKGYVYVSGDVLTKKELDYWINLSLDFNKKAKASKKRKKSRR